MKNTEKMLEDLKELQNFLLDLQANNSINTTKYRYNLIDIFQLLDSNKPYTTHFSTLHVTILIKIFNHVVKTKNYLFNKKDIPNLTHTQYGNFFTLQRFGLLFYPTDEDGKRIKGGYWGINLKRTHAFLRGDYKISKYYTRDKLLKQNSPSEEKITVHGVKNSDNCFKENVPDFINYVEL